MDHQTWFCFRVLNIDNFEPWIRTDFTELPPFHQVMNDRMYITGGSTNNMTCCSWLNSEWEGHLLKQDMLLCIVDTLLFIIPHRMISYDIISYRHISSHHTMSYHIISHHTMSYHIMQCHITSYQSISYNIISCALHKSTTHMPTNHFDWEHLWVPYRVGRIVVLSCAPHFKLLLWPSRPWMKFAPDLEVFARWQGNSRTLPNAWKILLVAAGKVSWLTS